MTREIIGIVISIMILGSGVLMVARPERFRDAQVAWWQTESGVWAFRLMGAAFIILATWGAARALGLY